MAEGWKGMVCKVPSHPNHAVMVVSISCALSEEQGAGRALRHCWAPPSPLSVSARSQSQNTPRGLCEGRSS